MLNHDKKQDIYYKHKVMRTDLMRIHCKNNDIHYKCNVTCIAWMLDHCKNNNIHYERNFMCNDLKLLAQTPIEDSHSDSGSY